MQRAHNEAFACTKLHARKSIKTPLSSAECIKASELFLCLKANNIWHNNI